MDWVIIFGMMLLVGKMTLMLVKAYGPGKPVPVVQGTEQEGGER